MPAHPDRRRWAVGSGRSHPSTVDGVPPWASGSSDIRAALRIQTVATAGEATRMRRAFGSWLHCDVPAELIDDLVLAAYEAVANAVEHAYGAHPGGGPVTLAARRSAEGVVVTVTDEGRWRPVNPSARRGHGLSVMRMLAEVHVASGTQGTVVRFRVLVPAVGLPPPGAERRRQRRTS